MPCFLACPDGPISSCAVLYMDVFGLREELFQMARAYARAGIGAAVPDLFYRLPISRFPVANAKDDPVDRAALAANNATTMQMTADDTRALVKTLGVRLPFAGHPRFLAIGYCMGGRHALAACAAHSDAFIGGVSAHGGRLVTQDATSPHLWIARLQRPFHFAFASDDPSCPEAHQKFLQDTARAHTAPVTAAVHAAHHGWSFPDRWAYDAATAQAVHEHALAMMNSAA